MGARWLGRSFSTAVLACGCATLAPTPPETPAQPTPVRAPAHDGAQHIVAGVAKARELAQRRTTPVLFEDDATFERSLERKAKSDAIPPTVADSPAFQLAFGFAELAESTTDSFAQTQHQQIIAFYDEVRRSVHVKASLTRDSDEHAWVVAHEIGHALQDQHFSLPPIAKLKNEDARLAGMALLEGDAMLAMLAYVSGQKEVPLRRMLYRVLRSMQVKAGSFAFFPTPPALDAPTLVRERLLFPYYSGLQFMGALYRSGGYALVNQSYRHPPTTTEHILHPEKYVAGETSLELAVPSIPDGYQELATGTVGELLIRGLLGTCVSAPQAAQAADGWGGDTFLIARRGDHGVLLWSTAWDSAAEARQFETAMKKVAGCWRKAGQRGKNPMRGVPVVQRRERVVAVTRGFEAAPGARATAQLLRAPLPPQRAKSAPFGDIELQPLTPATLVRPAFVSEGRIIAEHFGFVAPLPPGFRPKFEHGITLSRSGAAPITTAVTLSEWVVTPKTIEQSFSEFARGIAVGLDGELAVHTLGEVAKTPLGDALARTWALKSSPVRVRLLIVPVCAGGGALLVSQIWADKIGQRDLNAWLAALKPFGKAPLPVCAELDP